ncbi:MAG: hypothetical protein H6709_01210 [Kofleriaceae bacterium]|nr:hypothetical protein [Kofleriaceae bacterium]
MRRGPPLHAVACAAAIAAAAGCGGAPRPFVADLDEPLAARASTARALYTLWWNGARIGDAEQEVTRARRRGPPRRRREHVLVRRGDRLSASRVVITVIADRDLVARDVEVDTWGDGGPAAAHAERTPTVAGASPSTASLSASSTAPRCPTSWSR